MNINVIVIEIHSYYTNIKMYDIKQNNSLLANISNDFKVTSIEVSLQETIAKIHNLVLDYEDLKLKKKECDGATCRSSVELKNVIQAKNNIIQSIASMVTKLYETKDLNLIHDIFKIICGETPASPTPKQCKNDDNKTNKCRPTVPKNDKEDSLEGHLIHDESVSEIEGTPTGRQSPVFLNKKSRNEPNLSGCRDKKKCPDDWATPEKKSLKLIFPTPNRSKANGRLTQARLNLVRVKSTSVVDLTCSPEVKNECLTDDTKQQVKIKEENVGDETFLPSPSGTLDFQSLHKSFKSSAKNFKRPLSTLKIKKEDTKIVQKENKAAGEDVTDDMNQCQDRLHPPLGEEKTKGLAIRGGDESMSLLQQINKAKSAAEAEPCSPSKRAMVENKNLLNVGAVGDTQSSMSILRSKLVQHRNDAAEHNAMKIISNKDPVYKEPTVRKKSEKRALPGWSCEECRNFYDELYKDNLEMLAKKMDDCSKHRGRSNPIKPKTPPGFWYPRWDVPEDTEEFNKRNNAL